MIDGIQLGVQIYDFGETKSLIRKRILCDLKNMNSLSSITSAAYWIENTVANHYIGQNKDEFRNKVREYVDNLRDRFSHSDEKYLELYLVSHEK